MKTLERNLQYFERHRKALCLHHQRQFALIADEKLLGTYTTFEEAYNAGVAAFGKECFLVKQVMAEDPVAQSPALVLGLTSAE